MQSSERRPSAPQRELRGGSLGRQLFLTEVGGFVISETRHMAGFASPSHAHDRPSLNVVLAGAYSETVGGTSSRSLRGTAIAKPGGEVHSNHFGVAGARCLLLEVAPDRLGTLRRATDVFDRPLLFDARRAMTTAARIVAELPAGGALSRLALEALALELIVELSRSRQPPGEGRAPAWLRRVRDLAQAEPGRELSLSTMAREAARHPAHVAREFRRHFGCSIGEYVRRVRIEQAARALVHSDRTLSAIALDAGFYDHAHFAREFRRRTGLTPSQFRRTAGRP